MDNGYFEFGRLGYFIVSTYIAQLFLICFYPIPSAGSTYEMLFKRTASSKFSKQHLSNLDSVLMPEKFILIWTTLVVIFVSAVPLATLLLPSTYNYLMPLFKSPPKILSVVSVSFLIFGNIITFIAVFTLKQHVTFHNFGETTQLYTKSIFSFIRNPITLGLVAISVGFVFALPSVVMLFGLVVFLWNSSRRIKMEENYLQRTFGEEYLQYKKRVRKYWPKYHRIRG